MGRAVLFHGANLPLEMTRAPHLAPRAGEVLVRITCCTLCRSDLHTQQGRRQEPTPLILGHEIVGRIESFGPTTCRTDARGIPAEAGDRITWAVAASCGNCFFCSHDLPQKCDRLYKYGHWRADRERPTGGGLADQILLAPGTHWLRVPDELSDRVAAPANCATATVAGLMRQAGPIQGATVMVLGAGVLGLTACAMARAAGARHVLASDPSEDSLRRAQSFGATHCVSADLDDQKVRVAGLTEGRGADVVLELAGTSQSAANAIAFARTGGVVLLAGTVSPCPPIALDPESVVRRMLTIRGIHNYHPRDLDAALEFLAGAGRAYPFESLVTKSFSLDDVEGAFAFAQTHPGLRVAVVAQGGEQA